MTLVGSRRPHRWVSSRSATPPMALTCPTCRCCWIRGADVTLVPQQSVERLGVSLDLKAAYELLSFDGRKSSAQAVDLDLIFLGRTFKGRLLLTDQDCGILRRDVLNHLSLLLDGPKSRWLEHKQTAD